MNEIPADPTAPMTLLLNGDVHAPEHLGMRHILTGGGRILYIGTERPSFPAYLGVQEVDLEGRRVIPGLIDGHCHITGGGGEAGPASKVAAPLAQSYREAGVTTVVGVLGTDDVTRSTAELIAGVRALRAQGIDAWCHTGGYHLPLTTLTGSVRSDIVNVDCIIGVGEVAISDHRSSQPTLQELLRIASDAHVAGLMTGKAGILHLHVGDGPRGLELIREALTVSEIPARVFNPTHVNRRKALFDEAIDLAKTFGCYVDITDFPVAEGEDAWSAADALERYWESGAPLDRVTVSSDGGGCLPVFNAHGQVVSFDVGDCGALMRTVRELVRRGHALETVLPAFTTNAAAVLRLAGRGHIALHAPTPVLSQNHDEQHTPSMHR
ncbi:MAG TPA: beta-aspartyl-peptidase [Gemmatimonadaceae bacterium]|nr:beta-aspartyl-peptidase [Gemmatimonadaceae bacterium]